MDVENPVVKLCTAGARAEFEGCPAEARALYRQAWDTATDDFEACIAAHYVARFQDSAKETLRWNQEALARATAASAGGDGRVVSFYPSLYLSLGQAYETQGDLVRARHFYERAAALGAPHRMASGTVPGAGTARR